VGWGEGVKINIKKSAMKHATRGSLELQAAVIAKAKINKEIKELNN